MCWKQSSAFLLLTLNNFKGSNNIDIYQLTLEMYIFC